MTWKIRDLPWLPNAPSDFRQRLRALEEMESGTGREARFLAAHALDVNQHNSMSRVLRRLKERGALDALSPLTLGVVSSATMDLALPVLHTAAARHGVDLAVVATPFDQAVQSAIDADSELHRARPDAILVALHHASLGLVAETESSREVASRNDRALELVAQIRTGLREHSDAQVIYQTVPRPATPLLGNADFLEPGTPRFDFDRFHSGLRDLLEPDDMVLDVANLAEIVGLEAWLDERDWFWGRMPFAASMLPVYGDLVGRVLGAIRGTSRRVLVLDLDNTIWGGVIGDDGLEGIKIGTGDPVGEAFLAVQRAVLALRQRGVLLAVCSKNNDEIARQPFREHPDMLLREDHFAVFQANWSDKAANLEAISDALSLSLDSFVLLDDNPAERALVRHTLPEVAVPELPEDPSLFPRILMWSGYFEVAKLTDADRERVSQYSDNARRVELRNTSTDLESYLQSLDMTIQFDPLSAGGSARVAQLVNRSNQFNLTSRRYTEPEIVAMANDPALLTLQVRLVDTFGDNGMISVVIARSAGRILDIDTWLMSCRVLGRRVEQAVLNELVTQARARGVHELTGTYVPTPRNSVVQNHFAELGFTLVSTAPDGATAWRLELDAFRPFEVPIKRQAGQASS